MRFLSVGLLIVLVGCSPASNGSKIAAIPSMTVVRDSLKREVQVTARPKRIVSLTPANTEILFALGLDAEIVGVTSYCNYPEAAKTKPIIAEFFRDQASSEPIAVLKPDLVIAGGAFHQPVIGSLEKLNIPVVALDATQLADIWLNIETIGKLTGRTEEAEQLVTATRTELDRVSKRVAFLPRKKVFYALSNEPLMTVSAKTFISELIEIAGGENVFADATGSYPEISRESLLLKARSPDIVLYPKMGHAGLAAELNLLTKLQTITKSNCYPIDGDRISRPGPRLAEAALQIAEILHPSR
jgi:iron complex transport system substrate-binding protein